MKIYTIGYGGRKPTEFVALLTSAGVRAVVDIRLRPDRASMGVYTCAKTADKGIQGLLAPTQIQYVPRVELGNMFLEFDDWQDRYRRLLEAAGPLLVERLASVPEPFCLMCAEKRHEDCHRLQLAEYLARRGVEVEHIV